MKESVEVTDRKSLLKYIRLTFFGDGLPVPEYKDDELKIEFYCHDDRHPAWQNTWIIYLGGYGVIGFVNGDPA